MNQTNLADAPVLAIFAGGKSRRMGGRPKGRLLSPLSLLPIVEHLVEEASHVGMVAVLVGDATQYSDLATKTRRLADQPNIDGPVAGMLTAAQFAKGRRLICVGCDMPFVSRQVLEKILREQPDSPCLAVPRADVSAGFEPFLSRWDADLLQQRAEDLTRAGITRLRDLFKNEPVDAYPRDPEIARALQDWDLPGDVLGATPTQEP